MLSTQSESYKIIERQINNMEIKSSIVTIRIINDFEYEIIEIAKSITRCKFMKQYVKIGVKVDVTYMQEKENIMCNFSINKKLIFTINIKKTHTLIIESFEFHICINDLEQVLQNLNTNLITILKKNNIQHNKKLIIKNLNTNKICSNDWEIIVKKYNIIQYLTDFTLYIQDKNNTKQKGLKLLLFIFFIIIFIIMSVLLYKNVNQNALMEEVNKIQTIPT